MKIKNLILLLLLFVSGIAAAADTPYVYPSQLAPRWGFVRKAPCGPGVGDNCGSNPPTWHITPDQCGAVFSTSTARNADGSISANGVRYTLPLNSEFATAGMATGNGNPGNTGTANRESQCELHFVMALPYPSSYLRLGIDGVAGADKVTFIMGGSFHDMSSGDVVFPATADGILTIGFNGTSWLIKSGAPNIMEQVGLGQMYTNGQGRLFQVTADPTWWTVPSRIGKLAYCPLGGKGIVSDNNGGVALQVLPANCVYRDNATTSTITDWIVYRWIGNFNVAGGIAAGAAYAGGTAPDGVAYAGGNYVVLNDATLVAFVDGDTVEVHNMPTALGTKVNGKWIAKQLTAPATGCTVGVCLELHEAVHDEYGHTTANPSMIGPPSSFTVGDSVTVAGTIIAGSYGALTTSAISTNRATDPVSGTEIEGTLLRHAIVGVARRESGTGYSDATTKRFVASLYNPVEKKCQGVTASDRTTTSTTFVEVNADIRCNFVYLSNTSTQAASMGDQGRRVRYAAAIGAGNGTASDGCEFAVAFDGTTPEAEVSGFVNPAGVSGGRQTVSIHGQKAGLTETNHYITLLVRAVTGGTCTVNAATTTLNAYVWQ